MQTVRIDRSKEWTVEDYLQLGESATPCQLINGELIMSPAPSPNHQRVLRKLFKILDESITSGELFFAPIDLYVDRKNVFQPDLVYISQQNTHIVTERGIEGIPDLIIEIVSPSNVFTDRNHKRKVYQEIKVGEYWIVDPANKTLEIYSHNQADPDVPTVFLASEGEVTSSVIKNLSFDLKLIF